MHGWRETTLEDLAEEGKKAIISGPFGSNISSKYFVQNGVPVIRGNNLSTEIGKRFIDSGFIFLTQEKANELNTWAKKDDLIFTAAGTIGQVGILSGSESYKEFIISNKQLRVRLNSEKVIPLFAYYAVGNPEMVRTIQSLNTGSSVPLINLSVVKSLAILLPPLPEQKAIASVLSSLDDKIDLLHRQNKTLEAMAETLFRQWFVEEADESWEEVTLGYFADNIRDNINTASLSDFDTYIGLEHIPRRRIYIDNTGQTDTLESNKSKFSYHDILFGKLRSYFHKVSFAHTHGVCSTDILVIRPKSKELFPFCLFWFFSDEVVAHSDAGAEGTRMPRSNWGIISNYKVPKPDNPTIERFNNVAIPAIKKIEDNASQIKTLEKLRDTLLPKLMSGEVRVKV